MRDFIHRFGSSQNGHVHFDVGLDDWVAVDHWTSRKRVVVAVWLRCTSDLRFAPLQTPKLESRPWSFLVHDYYVVAPQTTAIHSSNTSSQLLRKG